MESSEDVEVLSQAIEKLLDEKRKREAAGDPFLEDHDDQLLLSTLFSQLQSPKPIRKTDGTAKEEESPDPKGKPEGHKDLEVGIEELAKDIKKVKRQNTVTHVLLSAMILLTVVWQLSEFSMVCMLKDRISHPVRSIGGMLSGMFKCKIRPIKENLSGTSKSKEQNNLHNGNGTNKENHLYVPELLREFGFNDDEE